MAVYKNCSAESADTFILAERKQKVIDMRNVKFQSNRLLFIYVLYAVVISFNDYLSYFTEMDYAVTLACSVFGVLALTIIYLKKNKIEWLSFSINVYDIIIVLIILVLCGLRSILPETSYDTSNYHLYYQKFFDRDFVGYDFFPMRSFNAQTFGALGDRLFYGFRHILGYRGGTFLNTLVIILIYFQVCQMIKLLWKEFGHSGKSKGVKLFFSVGALVTLMTECVYNNLSTYMVDYLAVPFLLEIVRMVIFSDEKDYQISHTSIYLCLIAGFAIGIKLTNILLILPFAIFYLIKNQKNINCKIVICSAIVLVLPLGVYLIISYKLTGNPLFPYLNGIFKSPYFSVRQSPNDYSGFNTRFGPKSLIEYFLWPFYMFKYVERASDVSTYSGRLTIIFIVMILAAFWEYKKFSKRIKVIYLYIVYCYALFLTVFHGYMRYVSVLEILGSIFTIIVLTEWIFNKHKVFFVIMGVVGVHFVLLQISVASDYYINKGYEWGWRNIKDTQRLKMNLPYVLHDYVSGISEEILNDIDCFLVTDATGSLASELKGDIPIIGINQYFSVTNDYTQQMLYERMQNAKTKNMYSLMQKGDFTQDISMCNEYGLALERIIPVSPNFYDKLYCLPLTKVKAVEGAVKSEVIETADENLAINISGDITSLDIFVGDKIDEDKRTDDEYSLSIVGINSKTGEKYTIEENAVITQRGEFMKKSLDLSKWDIDIIEIKKNIDENERGKWETFEVVLQEYS